MYCKASRVNGIRISGTTWSRGTVNRLRVWRLILVLGGHDAKSLFAGIAIVFMESLDFGGMEERTGIQLQSLVFIWRTAMLSFQSPPLSHRHIWYDVSRVSPPVLPSTLDRKCGADHQLRPVCGPIHFSSDHPMSFRPIPNNYLPSTSYRRRDERRTRRLSAKRWDLRQKTSPRPLRTSSWQSSRGRSYCPSGKTIASVWIAWLCETWINRWRLYTRFHFRTRKSTDSCANRWPAHPGLHSQLCWFCGWVSSRLPRIKEIFEGLTVAAAAELDMHALLKSVFMAVQALVDWTPRKYTLFCRAVTWILSQRLLHKMTNARQFW